MRLSFRPRTKKRPVFAVEVLKSAGGRVWPRRQSVRKRTSESFILGRGRAKGKQETDPVCAPEHRRQRGQAHPDFHKKPFVPNTLGTYLVPRGGMRNEGH